MRTRTVKYTIYHEVEVDLDSLQTELGRKPKVQDIKNHAFDLLFKQPGNIVFDSMGPVEDNTPPVRKAARSKQSY